jgi:RecG-like helicase
MKRSINGYGLQDIVIIETTKTTRNYINTYVIEDAGKNEIISWIDVELLQEESV